jgi:hypothetical protein
MARKTQTLVITADGRDKGATFLLTEMPARQAEKWATRALMAVARSSVYIPDEIQNMGMAAIAAIGIRALSGIQFDEAEPLMDEMMGCVMAMPDPAQPQVTRPLIDDDIDEVATLFKIREAIIELHTGFSIAGTLSKLREAPAQTESLSDTQTSPEQSG